MKFLSSIPQASVVTVNQELVEDLLARNLNNRGVRETHIAYLITQIATDQYCLTNNGIGIDIHGELIDGQHRLLALRAAEYPRVPILIVWGLPPESRAIVDQGLRRTMADIFHFAFKKPHVTALTIAICRFWGTYKSGVQSRKPTPTEMLEWYESLSPTFEGIVDLPNAHRLPSPVLAAICGERLANPDDERYHLFTEKLVSGASLEENSPVLKLRNWLAAGKSGTGGASVQKERFEKTLGALRAYLEDRTLSKLYAAARKRSK